MNEGGWCDVLELEYLYIGVPVLDLWKVPKCKLTEMRNKYRLLTLLRQMEFLTTFYTAKSGWSIVYMEGVTGYNFQNNNLSLSLKIDFVLANSADPDEIPHYAAIHMGISCLSKYPIRVFWFQKG